MKKLLYWGSLTLTAAICYYFIFRNDWPFYQKPVKVHYRNAVKVKD